MSTSWFKPHFLLVMFYLGCGFRMAAQSSSDFEHALFEFRSQNYAEAAAMFAKVDTAAPGSTDALLYRAKSLVHLADFTGADQALRAYLQSHRDSSDALYLLGSSGDLKRAPLDGSSLLSD
jgi:hypothetical protein